MTANALLNMIQSFSYVNDKHKGLLSGIKLNRENHWGSLRPQKLCKIKLKEKDLLLNGVLSGHPVFKLKIYYVRVYRFSLVLYRELEKSTPQIGKFTWRDSLVIEGRRVMIGTLVVCEVKLFQ